MNKYAIPDLDVEAVAKAIEADFGEPLPDIRQALTEAKNGVTGRVTTPEQILTRSARRACGMTQEAFAARINTPVATLRDWGTGALHAARRYTLPAADHQQPPRTDERA